MEQLDPTDAAKIKTSATYNNAAEHFDDPPLAFWDVVGRATIERLDLKPGAIILDVGCGTGASALPAAESVGPNGKVIGVDLAERLLEKGGAKAKAKERGLHNIEFRTGDMTNLGFPDSFFDGVVSVFSIFFVPDMEAQVRELWRMVKVGGKLAITTWGARFFEPVYTIWRQAVRVERPDLYSAFNPWDRIESPEQLRQLMQSADVPGVEITSVSGSQDLRSPEDWWTIVLGSGLRGTVDAMDKATATRIRDKTVNWVRDNGIKAIETNVLFATTIKV
ncbi:MAG TPA: class I SAM-dependent methyltransferase [Aggregatilineales bacterium]|nr:class I SAM-dependent methyltransferase [Aggregatilineales bacterium]